MAEIIQLKISEIVKDAIEPHSSQHGFRGDALVPHLPFRYPQHHPKAHSLKRIQNTLNFGCDRPTLTTMQANHDDQAEMCHLLSSPTDLRVSEDRHLQHGKTAKTLPDSVSNIVNVSKVHV
jgi:hypothetical protein